MLDDGFFAAGAPGILDHHFERMQINVAVRTILRAKAAADAPIFDDNFERVAPPNRADRAANHTQRITALAATGGDEILIEAQAVSHESRHAVVRVRAGVHASIAARAILQIQN